MSFEVDEDILQDFLVEAGEILELLQEQLVDLENNPDNGDLLNAIFRGYHTVKGGAGFLALGELVDICHGAENVFDTMRNRQRTLTPELMDVILQATDVVVEMFEKVKLREPLEAAPAELIEILHKLSKPETADEQLFASSEPATGDAQESETVVAEDEMSELVSEEDITLDADESAIDEITEDEFEALLDELHGKDGASSDTKQQAAKPAAPAASASVDDDDDSITDDEFEALLDNLHGQGSFSTKDSDVSETSLSFVEKLP